MFWSEIVLLALLIFALIVCFWAIDILVALLRTGVPFVKTRKKVRQNIIAHLPLRPGQKVYELGCGDASWLLECEKHCPQAEYYGYELSWLAWSLAQIKIWRRKSKIQVKHQNFFKFDLSEADIVYTYLLPELMVKLRPKFERELKPGALVVSLAFSIKDKQPERILVNKSGGQKNVFFYRY